MGKRSRPEETDGGGVNPFPPPEALSQATSSRGSKKSKPSPTEAGPDPSGVAFKRPPRKEPRKEKRAEKKARLEKDRQDKEKAENIDSVRQLQNLIAFSPQSGSDSDNEQRNGLYVFRLFLHIIAQNPDADASHNRKRYLREYLDFESQKYLASRPETQVDEYAGEEDQQNEGDARPKDVYFLNDLVNIWISSSRRNNEPLFATCARAIADLIELVMANPEFETYQSTLVKSLLDPQPLRLLNRGLSSPKYKHSLLVPCLKILVAMATTSNGAFVGQMYRHKDILCEPKCISKILSTYRNTVEKSRNAAGKFIVEDGDDEDALDDYKRIPDEAARVYGVKYITALIRYGDRKLKTDLLSKTSIFSTLFEYVKHDSAELLRTFLKAIRINIILDKTLHKYEKGRIFLDRSLAGLLVVVRNGSENVSGTQSGSAEVNDDGESDPKETQLSASEIALDFLQFVCASPLAGVFPTQASLRDHHEYGDAPSITVDDAASEIEPLIQIDARAIGSELIPKNSRHRFHNVTGIASILKPYASIEECNLLLDIFRLTPVIITQYFHQESVFPFEPKLSAAWIGYASFLFKTIQIPLPPISYLFHVASSGVSDIAGTHPTAEAIAHELAQCILPSPLTPSALEKCFNSTSDVIILFAVRILALATQKLQQAFVMLDKAAEGPAYSNSYYGRVKKLLHNELTQRCPDIKTVVTAFRRTPQDRVIMHEAVSRLLSLYYRVFTQTALLEQFDISLIVAQKFQLLQSFEGPEEDRQLHLIALKHLVHVARCSPGFQWWNRSDKLKFSPFVSLLRIVATPSLQQDAAPVSSSHSFRQTLVAIAQEYGIVQIRTEISPFDALIYCLSEPLPDKLDSELETATYAFLDECINRFVRKSAKYQDDLNSLLGDTSNSPDCPLSPIVAVIAEQWPFVQKNKSLAVAEGIARFICRFLQALQAIGESPAGVISTLTKMKDGAESGEKSLRKIFKDGLKKDLKSEALAECKNKIVSSVPSDSTPNVALQESASSTNRKSDTSRLLAEYNTVEAEEGSFDTDPLVLGALTTNRFSPFGPEKDSFPELFRWRKKADAETALEDGDIGALLYCLCSTHPEIRKQAFDQLVAFGRLLSQPATSASSSSGGGFKQADRILTLLGEALDTSKPFLDDGKPVPFTLASFTSHMIPILAKPGVAPDWLFKFVNRLLGATLKSDSRVWTLDRIPSQLAHRLLLDAPVDRSVQQLVQQQKLELQHRRNPRSFDMPPQVPMSRDTTITGSTTTDTTASLPLTWTHPSSHTRSGPNMFSHHLVWLLDFFLQSLQSPADVDIFDSANLFERILAAYSSPFSTDRVRARVLAIVYRVAHIPGGAATLVVRYGVTEWLGMVAVAVDGVGFEAVSGPDRVPNRSVAVLKQVHDVVREQSQLRGGLEGEKRLDMAEKAKMWFPTVMAAS